MVMINTEKKIRSYQKRINAGLCRNCGAKAAPATYKKARRSTGPYCEPCRDKAVQLNREWRKRIQNDNSGS